MHPIQLHFGYPAVSFEKLTYQKYICESIQVFTPGLCDNRTDYLIPASSGHLEGFVLGVANYFYAYPPYCTIQFGINPGGVIVTTNAKWAVLFLG